MVMPPQSVLVWVLVKWIFLFLLRKGIFVGEYNAAFTVKRAN